MIRAVLDTNISVSPLRAPSGNEAAVLRAIRDRALTPCLTTAILDEYEAVPGRLKFRFPPDQVATLLHGMRQLGLTVDPATGAPPSPDSSDTKFIACALAAQAPFLVTGNRRHFPAPRYGPAEVVNARELLARLPPA